MSHPKRHLLCAAYLAFLLVPLQAQESTPLPVKKVELYKNGMGYFEHLGTVHGQQSQDPQQQCRGANRGSRASGAAQLEAGGGDTG